MALSGKAATILVLKTTFQFQVREFEMPWTGKIERNKYGLMEQQTLIIKSYNVITKFGRQNAPYKGIRKFFLWNNGIRTFTND